MSPHPTPLLRKEREKRGGVDEQEQFWRVRGSFLFLKKGGITWRKTLSSDRANASRPFTDIFCIGKEMGSFLFPEKL
jgi:hypothetical protein